MPRVTVTRTDIIKSRPDEGTVYVDIDPIPGSTNPNELIATIGLIQLAVGATHALNAFTVGLNRLTATLERILGEADR